MKIVIASDHGGFDFKNRLVAYLSEKGYETNDVGANEYQDDDDYPDFASAVMKEVSKDSSSLGIVLCKNGVGVSVVANKFRGIRAALSFSKKHAESARKDDNANVLAIPSDYVDYSELMEIADAFLETSFSGAERHQRRLEKVAKVEEENLK